MSGGSKSWGEMEKIPKKEYLCINKAGVLPALFRCYLNISSSFLRLTKSKMPLVTIRKMTSNLLCVDFDIPTPSRILQPAFFLTSLNGCILEKRTTIALAAQRYQVSIA